MRRFDEIWIPDYAMEPSLGGELSHPPSIPRRAYYIGPLTRFARSELCPPICRKIIAIISGPEPQRSMFENLVVSQLTGSPLSGLILLGKSEERSRREIREGVEVVSHLDAAELQYEIERSEVVVSRPGYSTLMDLASLRKPAVFVATPGQTEQEYLASRLSHQPGCVVQSQEEFDLGSAVSQLNSGDSPLPESGASVSLDDRLDYWLNRAAV